MRCRHFRSRLIDALAGELDDEARAAFEAHRMACPRCAGELAGLEATAALLEAVRPAPRRLDVWAALAPELDRIDAERAGRATAARGWWPVAAGLALAATLLLTIALGVWLSVGREGAPPPVVAGAGAGPGVAVRVDRFVDRSKPLLMSLANRDVARTGLAGFDLAVERRLARRLAHEGRALGVELHGTRLRRERALVGDLELLFMQVANTPERRYRAGLEVVQETIARRALLLEVGLQELRRAEGPPPKAGAKA